MLFEFQTWCRFTLLHARWVIIITGWILRQEAFSLSALLESGNHSGGVSHLLMLPSCFRRIHDRTTSLWKNDSLNYYGGPLSLVIIMADANSPWNWQWHDRMNVRCFHCLASSWRSIVQNSRTSLRPKVLLCSTLSTREVYLTYLYVTFCYLALFPYSNVTVFVLVSLLGAENYRLMMLGYCSSWLGAFAK